MEKVIALHFKMIAINTIYAFNTRNLTYKVLIGMSYGYCPGDCQRVQIPKSLLLFYDYLGLLLEEQTKMKVLLCTVAH